MQEDPNTEHDDLDALTDPEVWEIAFESYSEHPIDAYALARVLTTVKRLLQTQPPYVSHAVAALDEACRSLFTFSQFREAGYDLFRVAIEGRATRAQENLMESLGIRY